MRQAVVLSMVFFAGLIAGIVIGIEVATRGDSQPLLLPGFTEGKTRPASLDSAPLAGDRDDTAASGIETPELKPKNEQGTGPVANRPDSAQTGLERANPGTTPSRVSKEKTDAKDPDSGAGPKHGDEEIVDDIVWLANILATYYAQSQSKHFFIETSHSLAMAENYLAFLETQYRKILKWSNRTQESGFWKGRAHVAVLTDKGEWEVLMQYHYRAKAPDEMEKRIGNNIICSAEPPRIWLFASEDSKLRETKLRLLYHLSNLCLLRMGTSPNREVVPWLYEGVAIGWEIEAFGDILANQTRGERRINRIWDDPNDWVKLLKREVKKKSDGYLLAFWRYDAVYFTKPVLVKIWSLVQYLTRDSDARTRFLRFIGIVHSREDQAKALKTVYDLTHDGLDREWRKWIKQLRSTRPK
jgi:hypothetical protein